MPENFKSDPFYCRITGDYAMFTTPETKAGGERFTYQVPTYSALKGIIKAAYWKPSLIYVIDEVKIVNQIKTENMGARALFSSASEMTSDLNVHTYLKDVEYLVKFHFEWNTNYSEFKNDWDEKKHERILLRSLERGGRRDCFLGTRECVGHIERIRAGDYRGASTYYDNEQFSLGIMFHSFTYPNQAYSEKTKGKLTANYTSLQLKDGTLAFPRPEDCDIKQVVSDYNFHEFKVVADRDREEGVK